MAGYLDEYGVSDEKRAKTIRRVVLWLVVLAAAAGVLLAVFHNFSEDRQVKRFLARLEARDYKGAYALWGCSDAHPCRDYSMTAFLQDWGPQAVPPGKFEVLDGESCGSGVIVDADLGAAGDRKLWVESTDLTIGFPPYEQCPQRNRIADFVRNIKYRLHGRTYK
jgi:hypothetical protein